MIITIHHKTLTDDSKVYNMHLTCDHARDPIILPVVGTIAHARRLANSLAAEIRHATTEECVTREA